MTPRKKLQLLLLRDSFYYFAIGGFLLIPRPLGALLIAAVLAAAIPPLAKAIRGADHSLSMAERHIYLAFSATGLCGLVTLITLWAIRHHNWSGWLVVTLAASAAAIFILKTMASLDTGPRSFRLPFSQGVFAWVLGFSIFGLLVLKTVSDASLESGALASGTTVERVVPGILLVAVLYRAWVRRERSRVGLTWTSIALLIAAAILLLLALAPWH